jgi:hypothetical protein
MKPHDWLLLAGCLMLIGGVAWVYAPAGLILAGLVLVRAHAKIEKRGKPDA